MSPLLKKVLSRWESNPPVISAEEAFGVLQPIFASLRSHSILRPTSSSAAFTCTECGERCRVTHISDKAGDLHGYIHCRDCGIVAVPPHALERWELDAPGFLTTAFRDIQLAIHERVARHLWQVGKAHWAGRTREVWFARSFRRDAVSAVTQVLASRPKAILFAPTELGAGRWQEITPNLTLALESTLTLANGSISFDAEYVAGRLVDAGLGPDTMTSRPTKKRGDRAANIESLRKEMIEHLRAARDRAFDTREQTGEPELLPRPTQKALGERVGLSEPDVSRCLRDPEARELQLYWKTALDLDQLMAWKGPLTKGRKT